MLYNINKLSRSSSEMELAIANLRQIIIQRIQAYFSDQHFNFHKWPKDHFKQNLIGKDINEKLQRQLTVNEWIILMLGLMPHISPNFFESIIQEHLPAGGDFPEFGGVKGSNHRSMLPTGETVQFIMSGRIILAQDWIDKILFNVESSPRFGLDFPAKKVVTNMNWDDVVLHPHTMQQVNDISVWLKYNHKVEVDKNLGRKIKPGYRVLFYGPSGTGKTLTTALLGKQFGKDVYRIDLSQIVSKFIGETEKNLETVFRKAETKDWILFFDEADALFGKRTNVSSAHDKYANQEVSYLLQRVEDYPGLLILASNFKSNLDDAFLRRFHSLVHFPMPVASERLAIWKKSLPENLKASNDISLEELARQYEMSGASILNAVHFAALQCYAREDKTINQADLLEGIKKEFFKEEKSFT